MAVKDIIGVGVSRLASLGMMVDARKEKGSVEKTNDGSPRAVLWLIL